MMEFPNISGAKQIVVDTETDGLDWKRSKVVGYVVTLGPRPDESFYFPVAHAGGGNVENPEAVRNWIRSWDKRIKIIGHHLKFDLHMFMNDGVPMHDHPLECTQVNHALIDENARGYGLEDTALYYKVQAKKGAEIYTYLAEKFGGEPKPEQMEHFHELAGDDPVAVDYARGDGMSTWQIHVEQSKELDAQELRRVWAVECRCIRAFFRMERRGVEVDEHRVDEFRSWVNRNIEVVESRMPPGFNSRSPLQVREYLESKGRTEFPKTPKGNYSFTREWLEEIPEGADIIALRQLTNILNSFLDPLVERHLFNGRVHTNFNQLKLDDYGTVSGRPSSNDPNMLQVPKRNKILAPRFRYIFGPGKGNLWSANDYEQQEYVLFAEYTQDPLLIKGYNSDPVIDAHQMVADMLSVERDPTAKRLNLAKIYGMGITTLASRMNISIPEAKQIAFKYDLMFPAANTKLQNSMYQKAQRLARARGYVKTLLGRRRRLANNIAHKAMNQIIQGTCADITKTKMCEIDEYLAQEAGDDAWVNLQVYDELDWIVPDSPEGMKWNAVCLEMMQDFGPDQPIHLEHVPLRVDAALGKDWGQASFPKFDWGTYNDPI